MTSTSVFGQLAKEQGRWERMLLEGDPVTLSGTEFSGTLTGGATNQSLVTLSLPSLSRAVFAESVTITSNRQFVGNLSIPGPLNGLSAFVPRFVIGPNTPVTVPLRCLLRPSSAPSGSGSTTVGTVANRNGLDATLTGAIVNAFINGISLYDDFDFGASKVGLIVGDSILAGTSGLTQKYQSMEWLLRERFRNNGQRLRLIGKAYSGTTTTDHERMRAFGMYGGFPQLDLIVYMLGVNDVGQSISSATSSANISAFITWKQRVYPTALLLVLGPTPAENNTTETGLAAIRTAASGLVTTAADPLVKYIDLGSSFDRTQGTTVYSSSDSAGSRVHPNATGHQSAYNAIDTALTGFGITTL